MKIILSNIEGLLAFIDQCYKYEWNNDYVMSIQMTLFFEGHNIDSALDSIIGVSDEVYEAYYLKLSGFLANLVRVSPNGMFGLQGILRKLYATRCKKQKTLGKRLHKALELHNEGILLLATGKKNTGVRMVTLALIEDMLHPDPEKPNWELESHAFRFLATKVYNEAITKGIWYELKSRIDELSIIKKDQEIWYPDEVLDLKDHLAVLPGIANELVCINDEYYKELLDELSNNDDTGKHLETLVKHLFSSITGSQLIDTRVLTKSSELDLVFRILDSYHPLYEMFGQYLVVECKNWDKPVGSAVIRSFVGNLQSLSVRGGILITRHGITGDASCEDEKMYDKSYARLEIVKAYHRHGITVTILDMSDLQSVKEGCNIVRILLANYEKIRFDMR